MNTQVFADFQLHPVDFREKARRRCVIILEVRFHVAQMRDLTLILCNPVESHFEFMIDCNHGRSANLVPPSMSPHLAGLHYTIMRRTQLHLLIAAVFLILAPCDARAELLGDPKLLRQAADLYRANLDQLRTWKGQAEIKMESEEREKDKHDNIRVESAVEFAYDAESGDYRYDIDVYKDVSLVDGKEKPRFRPERRASVFTDCIYHELVFKTDNPSADRTAYIRAKKSLQAGISCWTFEALFYFTDQGTPLDENLQVLYDNFNHAASHGGVSKEGDIVKVIQAPPNGGLTFEWWLDQSQGGNLVKVETTETMGEDTMHTVVAWNWKQVNGVWVPNRVVQDRAEKKRDRSRKQSTTVKWDAHRVNSQLSQDEFGLENLGLRRGDRIRDTRTQTDRVFE